MRRWSWLVVDESYFLKLRFSVILQRSQRFCSVTVTVLSHRPVPRRSKSSHVLNRIQEFLKNDKGRLSTLEDVGRFRTPRGGTVTEL